jgi:hypothetical protein
VREAPAGCLRPEVGAGTVGVAPPRRLPQSGFMRPQRSPRPVEANRWERELEDPKGTLGWERPISVTACLLRISGLVPLPPGGRIAMPEDERNMAPRKRSGAGASCGLLSVSPPCHARA